MSTTPAAEPAGTTSPATVPPAAAPTGPGATIDVRRLAATRGAIITLTGSVGRNAAAMLSRQLHAELEAGSTVIVVNLRQVDSCDPTTVEVLAIARERARAAGIALHVVDPAEHVTTDRRSR